MSQTKKIKVIGAGGIGSHLVEPLARYLNYTEHHCEVMIIDGDFFEDRNRERQRFGQAGINKAVAMVSVLREQFPKVHFRSKDEYLTENNVVSTIREKDVVFLGVDNHATRKLVSDRCCELEDVLLISGGNGYTDGDVLVHWKKDGRDMTPPIAVTAPEIKTPKDKNPGEFTDVDRQGCQEEALANPQLLFTNLDIACCMLNCYYAYEQGRLTCKRVFSDILTQARRAIR
jgi:molybdopterin/thiamine biosynthesis adenylyltransferase